MEKKLILGERAYAMVYARAYICAPAYVLSVYVLVVLKRLNNKIIQTWCSNIYYTSAKIST